MDFPPPSSLSWPLLYFLTLGKPSLISDPPFFGSSFPKAFSNCPVFDLLSGVACPSFENRLPTSWISDCSLEIPTDVQPYHHLNN